MIDIENFVLDKVADALRAAYPGIYVAGEYTPSPTSFPAVTIMESDNSTLQKMRTLAPGLENAAQLMYEVNVYTNSGGYRKQEAKAVMDTVDDAFLAMGFTRTMCNPISNLQDATIYRMTARYEGVADRNFRIYTN